MLVGYRKLIGAVVGVIGLVLTTYFGVPEETVQTAQQAFTELASIAIATFGIVMVIWKQITEQAKVDKSKAEAEATKQSQ